MRLNPGDILGSTFDLMSLCSVSIHMMAHIKILHLSTTTCEDREGEGSNVESGEMGVLVLIFCQRKCCFITLELINYWKIVICNSFFYI